MIIKFKYYTILLVMLMVLGNIQAQDDLFRLKSRLVESTADSTSIKLNLQIATIYLQNQNDSGLIYTEKALSLAQGQEDYIEVFNYVKELAFEAAKLGLLSFDKACYQQLKKFSATIKHDSLRAISLYGIANSELAAGDYNQALLTIEKVASLLKNAKLSPLQLIIIDAFKAGVYNVLQQYEKSITIYVKALKSAEQHQILDQQVICLNGLSQIHLEQNNFDKSIDYCLQALDVVKSIEHPIWEAAILLDLGKIYIRRSSVPEYEQTSMNLAKKHFESALEKGTAMSYPPIEGGAYLNLGVWYYKTNEFKKSNEDLLKALPILEAIGDQGNGLRVYFKLAALYQKLAEENKNINNQKAHLEKAVLYGEKAYEHSSQLGVMDVQLNSTDLLNEVYAELENFGQAYLYLKINKALKDSLFSGEKTKIIEETAAKFQNEKQALEIDLLNKEKDRQATIIYSIIIGSAIIFLFLIIVYSLYQQKRKANKELLDKNTLITAQKEQLNNQNEEKEILLKEIHHRVKNNLQTISSLLDLQSNKIEDESVLSAIADGQNRVKSMALIHHKLYQNEDIATVNFKEYSQQLATQILASFSLGKLRPKFEIADNEFLDIDTAIPLGLILNELLTNACKYAFEQEKEGSLLIKLKELSKGEYQLEVKDNGPGMPSSFDIKKARSLGLRLVRRLSKQLFGKTEYQNDNGAHFIVTFKDTTLRKTID